MKATVSSSARALRREFVALQRQVRGWRLRVESRVSALEQAARVRAKHEAIARREAMAVVQLLSEPSFPELRQSRKGTS